MDSSDINEEVTAKFSVQQKGRLILFVHKRSIFFVHKSTEKRTEIKNDDSDEEVTANLRATLN